MASEKMSIMDRFTQNELGERLRERYGDPCASTLTSQLATLLDALRDASDVARPVPVKNERH